MNQQTQSGNDVAAQRNMDDAKLRDALRALVKEQEAAPLQSAPETGFEGKSLQSMPGHKMVYNDHVGMAGVDIEAPDGTLTSFGGKQALQRFIEEKGISAEDAAALRAIDARADPFRSHGREREAENAQTGKGAEEGAFRDAPKSRTDNRIESAEAFTAAQADMKAVMPPDIERQYVRMGDKLYHPRNASAPAFEDKGSKLETGSDSEAVAESMVRIAQARGWEEIKVSGSEVFRKEVWLEAASRGMHVKGYSPEPEDELKLEVRMRNNKPDPVRQIESSKAPPTALEDDATTAFTKSSVARRRAETFADEPAQQAVKKHTVLAGAVAAMSAIEKKVEADGLDNRQRAVVMARVRQNVVESIERDETPQVNLREASEIKRSASEDKEFTR
jgi:hypothetical protein